MQKFLKRIKAEYEGSIQWNEPNGCGAILDFLILLEEESQLMNNDDMSISDEVKKEDIDSLLRKCNEIKAKFNITPPASKEKSVACAETLSFLGKLSGKLHFLKDNKFKNVPQIRDDLYKEILTL